MKSSIADAAVKLRREFDEAFALRPATDPIALEGFLALRIAGDPYAVRIAEAAGLHRSWRVVPVPSDAPELLGIAGRRGAIVPVYDLGALLGYPRLGSTNWLLTIATPLLAFAFERFEAHVRAPATAVTAHDGTSGRAHGTVGLEGVTRPLLRLSLVVEEIARRAREASARGS